MEAKNLIHDDGASISVPAPEGFRWKLVPIEEDIDADKPKNEEQPSILKASFWSTLGFIRGLN